MKKLLLLMLCCTIKFMEAQELKPTMEMALVQVKAIDDKNIAQASSEIIFISQKDKKPFKGKTDATGKFNLLLPVGQKFEVLYKAFSDVKTDLVLELPVEKTPYRITYTITVTPPKTFTLDHIFFDTGKWMLRPESYTELNELVAYLQLRKTMVIEIGGHTDNVGTPESNQKLSENRAMAVKKYLEQKGIAAGRVLSKGYGDTQPIAENDSPENRQKNRRTEVTIISE
ncbi:MAG: OmpA family protein [Chitinophagales bacterium]